MKIVLAIWLVIILFEVIYFNYPLVWYSTEDQAFAQYAEIYGDSFEKETTTRNGNISINRIYKNENGYCSVVVVKQLFGYKIKSVYTSKGNVSTITSGFYKSITIKE